LAGWALDFHSRFVGHEQVRGVIGDLVFRYKYQGEHQLADELACCWADLLAAHPELPRPEAVLPIPPSTPRTLDPVMHLASALATRLEIPVQLDTLVKTRKTRQQKGLKSLAAKQSNVAGAFKLQGRVMGQHLLLVDDLYDSGATLSEAARTLSRDRPASLVVLTLTKTVHSDL
jgi:predicted amidophosphoribosyltransferase